MFKSERENEHQEEKKYQDEEEHQVKKKNQEEEEHQGWNEEEGLTVEEQEELTRLHEEAMEPSQVEEDWMLLVMIKEERKSLANKYLPKLANYKIEDICEVCDRYFYKEGNLKSHMERVHMTETKTKKFQVVPEDDWLSKSLPNLNELLATVPA